MDTKIKHEWIQLVNINGYEYEIAEFQLEIMGYPVISYKIAFVKSSCGLFHIYTPLGKIYTVLLFGSGSQTGWWLGHPSEKYERQLG